MHEISASVRQLEDYEGVSVDDFGISGKPNYIFSKAVRHPSVPAISNLPRIQTDEFDYYLVPANIEVPQDSPLTTTARLLHPINGEAFMPRAESDWIASGLSDDEIYPALLKQHHAVANAYKTGHDKALLDRERSPFSGLFAGASEIADIKPMLVDGFIVENGVSVLVGDMDEFKTTVCIDLAVHIALGVDWQGMRVHPRPVIYYALDDDIQDIRGRIVGLETKLRAKSTVWGDDFAPITVRDRILADRKNALRQEVYECSERYKEYYYARCRAMGIEENEEYTFDPVIVVDTLSAALDGKDEKGAPAVEFIHGCHDLLKERPDLEDDLRWPVASHVIILHHLTKNGSDFAGHRAIGADTSGLYRVHRFGRMTDNNRSLAGRVTPMRTKGMQRPAPINFEAEVVPIPGTKQTALILKDKAPELPPDLLPIIEALRECDDPMNISPKALNACLDVVAAGGERDDAAKRQARQRYRRRLEEAGIIEPVLDDGDKVSFYRFHDFGVAA